MRKNLLGLLLVAGIFSVACDDAKNDKSPEKCDAKSYKSSCLSEGDKLSVCRDGSIDVIDCAKEGKKCGKDENGNNACIAQGGTATETRECQNNTLKVCTTKDGKSDCTETDCAKEGKKCGKDENGNNACIAQGGTATETRECQQDTLKVCTTKDGKTDCTETDCTKEGKKCGKDKNGKNACIAQGGTPVKCEKAGKFCSDSKTLVVCTETEDDDGNVTLKGEEIKCRDTIESCVDEPYARCALDCTNAKVGDWNLECNITTNSDNDYMFYHICLQVGADNSGPMFSASLCVDGKVLNARDACLNPGGSAAYEGKRCSGTCSTDARKCELPACEGEATVCKGNTAVHCLKEQEKAGFTAGKWEEDCTLSGGVCTQLGDSGVSACDTKCNFQDGKVAWENGRCEGNALVKCKKALTSGGEPTYSKEDCGQERTCGFVKNGNYYACNYK